MKRRLDEATRMRTTDEWLEHLLAHDVWCAPVNDLDRVVEDPQVVHNDILITLDHPTAGPIRVVGSPVRFSGTPSSVRGVPPELGQHTGAILHDVLDMSEEDIARARASAAHSARPGRCRRPDRMPTNERAARYLVTGAAGCIGAWTMKLLLEDGRRCHRRRPSPDRRRLRLVAGDRPAADAHSSRSTSPIATPSRLLVETERITHVIHLAALQAPFCQADPRAAAPRSMSPARSTSSRRRSPHGTVSARSCTRARRPSSGQP